ncbi:HD domain-containing phosphohydrolase [Methylomonas sp. AM2-LC]|uniref:HD domain-containing phosphohydrolase n=1 Tax=Methylomonas sp. AM2-LC TaxID=3153301 RepID=UPI003267550B
MNAPIATISQKILFVDDEVLLLEGIKRQLRRDLDVDIAEGPLAALTLLAEQGPFAVVVSDYNMPDMDGIAFLNEVYTHYPKTVLVMLTGRTELDIAVNALHNAHISRFLNKPCPKEILLETLQDGLEQYRLRISEELLQIQLQQSNAQLNELNNHLESLVAEKTLTLQIQYQYAAQMTRIKHINEIVSAYIATLEKLTGLTDLRLWLSPHQDAQFSCYYPALCPHLNFNAQALSNGLLSTTLKHRQTWCLEPDTTLAVGEQEQGILGDRLLMLIPLVNQQDVLGLLVLAGDALKPLSSEVRNAVNGMTDITATALQSYWYSEAQEEAQDAIITSLAKLSEYRDPETGAHLERLKRYCYLICQYLATTDKFRDIVTPAFSKDLVRSSPLHDIGKVGIVDAILKKPGRLTPEEFEIMKHHAAIGGDTLRSVYEKYPSQSFIKCGMDVAYGHHEKWDGSGYPLGLQGEAIPLVARILALVDVYDALTCRRVYKPPFPREKANSIILEGKGSHFDPDMVDAFIVLEADFHAISELLADVIEEPVALQ